MASMTKHNFTNTAVLNVFQHVFTHRRIFFYHHVISLFSSKLSSHVWPSSNTLKPAQTGIHTVANTQYIKPLNIHTPHTGVLTYSAWLELLWRLCGFVQTGFNWHLPPTPVCFVAPVIIVIDPLSLMTCNSEHSSSCIQPSSTLVCDRTHWCGWTETFNYTRN